jgi:hypothetical protein
MKPLHTLVLCAACALCSTAFAEADQTSTLPALGAGSSVPISLAANESSPPPMDPGSAGRDGIPEHGGPRPGPMGMGFGPHGGGPNPMPPMPPEVHAAIETIREIEGLYESNDRSSELPAFYRSVLAKTHDPIVRNYLFRRLADTELKPAHVDPAIKTLDDALDETLVRLDNEALPSRPGH